MKFIFAEPERPALVKFLTSPSVTSEISRLEVKRAVSRFSPSSLELASEELAKIRLIEISKSVLLFAENFTDKFWGFVFFCRCLVITGITVSSQFYNNYKLPLPSLPLLALSRTNHSNTMSSNRKKVLLKISM